MRVCWVCCAERQTSGHGMSISTKGANKTQKQTARGWLEGGHESKICVCMCMCDICMYVYVCVSDCLSNKMLHCDENGQTASCFCRCLCHWLCRCLCLCLCLYLYLCFCLCLWLSHCLCLSLPLLPSLYARHGCRLQQVAA